MAKNRILHWLPAIVWTCTIIYLSSLSGESVQVSRDPTIEYQIKNVLHAIEYATLAATLALPLYIANKNASPRRLLFIWIWCIFFAWTDELHQKFSPHRDSSIGDWILDGTGSGLMLLAIYKLKKKLK